MAGLRRTMSLYLPWERGHRVEFFHNFLLQTYFTFVQSILMVGFLGLFSGIAIAFQSNLGLALLGTNEQIGKILVFIVFRELSPLAASVVMITRSITAIASEMATVKVQQEVEALQILGINIYHFIMAPRIAGGAVSLFCMAIVFWAFALWGGWIGSNVTDNFPADQYLTLIAQSLSKGDFPLFLLKTSMIGAMVTYLAVKRGLAVQGAPFEVPIATNRAVIDAMTLAMGVQFVISAGYYVTFGIDL